MHVRPSNILTCPHDGMSLAPRGDSLVCASGHSFDRAREGYVNLLPVQDKASLDPGDTKQMVAARRHFLETGAYAPIADAVSALTIALISKTTDVTILDAGCGEGYYLQALAIALSAHASPATVRLAGIDISKWAVRAAAKRNVAATWVVASNRRPPLPDASADLILCLFGFPIWSGFAAIQPPGGHVLLVDPGPNHLLELRAIIYPEVRVSNGAPTVATDAYTLVSESRHLSVAHVASPALIADLLSMTPHAHRASLAGRSALVARTHLEVTIDVTLRVFRRLEN